MLVLSNFILKEKLFESSATEVFRAKPSDQVDIDQASVILKILKDDAIGNSEINRYRHEFSIIKSLSNLNGSINAYSLNKDGCYLYIALEDIGGISLEQFIENENADLLDTIKIAEKIAVSLGEIHDAHVIHLDINPSNIIYNVNSEELKIIDFGLSTVLPVEAVSLSAPSSVQGTIEYMSPEQTGRMNRATDYRSDLYSFGATLHTLFTGSYLFPSRDPLELLHSHIACEPKPLHHINNNIPIQLSNIIAKLLNKNAEDRYQSAIGVAYDLKKCYKLFKKNKGIDEFQLAQHDKPIRSLQLSQHLYGRSEQIQSLLKYYDMTQEGSKSFVVIEGSAGIGKSSIVKELYKPITMSHGYFIGGKFNQFETNTPYQGFINAFTELANFIFSESKNQLEKWRNNLQESLSVHGKVITDLVPKFESIIGPQPPLKKIDASQAKNRFNEIIIKFIKACAQPEHPIVMFLDDLQWADKGSMLLLRNILFSKDIKYFMIIGACRSEEIVTKKILNEMKDQKNFEKLHLNIEPLTLDAIKAWLLDTFSGPKKNIESLATVILDKTGGNPFFIEEFFYSLVNEGILSFDTSQEQWAWCQDKIEEFNITNNVVDLLTKKLTSLSKDSQSLLQIAATIGGQFNLLLLSKIYQRKMVDVVHMLLEPLKVGLIVPENKFYKIAKFLDEDDDRVGHINYKFAHDRIQQAAYQMLPIQERQSIHWRIGKTLLSDSVLSDRKYFFYTVNQLNQGFDCHQYQSEKDNLARLNLLAAKHAKSAVAHQAAADYCNCCLNLLDASAWQYEPDLTFEAYLLAAESAYLVGLIGEIDGFIDKILFHIKAPAKCVQALNIRLVHYSTQEKHFDALNVFHKIMCLLGYPLPRNPSFIRLLLELLKTVFMLKRYSLENISKLPMNHNEHMDAVQSSLVRGSSSAYFSDPNLAPIVIFRQIQYSLLYGKTANTPFALAAYSGGFLCSQMRLYNKGHEYAQLSLKMSDQQENNCFEGRTKSIIALFVLPWQGHLEKTLAPLKDSYEKCLEDGDMEYFSYSIAEYQYNTIMTGRNLSELDDETQEYLALMKRFGLTAMMYEITLYSVIVRQFINDFNSLEEVVEGDLKVYMSLIERSQFSQEGLCYHYYFCILMLACFFNYPEEGMSAALKLRKHVPVQSFNSRLSYYYCALIQAQYADGKPYWIKQKCILTIKRYLKKLHKLPVSTKVNFEQKIVLLEAEVLRLKGCFSQAMIGYDEAIKLAKKNNYVNDEAIINERAGRLYFQIGLGNIADVYLKQAKFAYEYWGASAKVRMLRGEFGDFTPEYISDIKTSKTDYNINVDLGALRRTAKAIAEESTEEGIIHKALSIAIRFAGAQGGTLLLYSEGEFSVSAEAFIQKGNIVIQKPNSLESCVYLCMPVIDYAKHSLDSVVISDAQKQNSQVPGLSKCDYIYKKQVKSILCAPLVSGDQSQHNLLGMIYLENNHITDSFRQDHIETLEVICVSAASRLKLARQAIIDGLTGLYNRAYFQTSLQQVFDSTLQNTVNKNLSIALADIDHFKKFNDEWGHQLGDAVLQHVSYVIKNSCRGTDIVARYGGEEIVVIMPGTDANSALLAAQRILKNIQENIFVFDEKQHPVTISLGLSTFDDTMREPKDFIRKADEALYQAKENGRNQVCIASTQ